MNDPFSRCHPLHVTGGNCPVVSHAIAVINGSGEDVSNCFDAQVGVPWESRQIIFWYIVPKIVQEQEGVKIGGISETEGAAQMNSRALECRLRLAELLDRPEGHKASSTDFTACSRACVPTFAERGVAFG